MIQKENLTENNFEKERKMDKPKVIVIVGPTASRENWPCNRTCKTNKWRDNFSRFYANI